MIKPTVGRVVWFYPDRYNQQAQPLAAVIAHVWSDTCVNLAIFDANGRPLAEPPTSVRLVQPEEVQPTDGHVCTWRPFQVGQSQAVKDAQSQVKS